MAVYDSSESDNKKMEVKEMENIKEVNLWLKKEANGMWKVCGFVRDNDTHEVIPAATVGLAGTHKLTNDRGFYSFSGINPGVHIISAQKDGYGYIQEEIRI